MGRAVYRGTLGFLLDVRLQTTCQVLFAPLGHGYLPRLVVVLVVLTHLELRSATLQMVRIMGRLEGPVCQ